MTQPTSKRLVTEATIPGHVATQVTTPGTATRGALDATYAPLGTLGTRPGMTSVTLGDSITQANDQDSTKTQGSSWPHYLGIHSAQRANIVRNAGIAGNNTAQMLARFDTDVAPYKPTTLILLGGTNDIGQGVNFTTWKGQVEQIVGKAQSIGAVPVLATIPPNDSTARHQQINQFNAWICSYAGRKGLTVIPFHELLVDPANGKFKTLYYNDGTHPNSAGQAAMGKLAADTLASVLPVNRPPIAVTDADPNNNIYGGCFTAGTGAALAPGWIDDAGIPAGSVLSYATDAGVPGQMVKITQTATTLSRVLAYYQYIGATTLSAATLVGATSLTIPIRADFRGTLYIGSGSTFEAVKILSSSGGGPQTETLVEPLKYAHAAGETVIANAAPGDELIFTGRVTSDGGVTFTADTTATGAAYSPAAAKDMVGAVTRGVFHQRFTVPAGTTGINYRLIAGIGTGVVQFGQVSVYNATRLGML